MHVQNHPIFISKKGKTRFENRIRNSERKRAKFKEIVPWEGCGEGELRSVSKNFNGLETNQNMGCRGVYIYMCRVQARLYNKRKNI